MSSSSEPHTELFIADLYGEKINFEYDEIDPYAAKHTYGRDDDLWDEFCYYFGSSENQAEWLTKNMGKLLKEKVKDEWKRFQALRSIDREIPYVDIKPYSHNLISNYLRMLAGDDNKLTSKEDMNKIIVEKGLDKLGWELCKLD